MREIEAVTALAAVPASSQLTWTPPTVAWVTRDTWSTPNTYTLYDTQYRMEYIQMAGGAPRTAPRNNGKRHPPTAMRRVCAKYLSWVGVRR